MMELVFEQPNKKPIRTPWNESTQKQFEDWEILLLEDDGSIWRGDSVYTLEKEE